MKRLFIIIILVVLLCVGAGVAFWFFVIHKNAKKEKQTIKKTIPVKKPLITYKLPFPHFMVNITKNNQWRGVAFINFEILFKTQNSCQIFENKPFIIESILLQKIPVYLSTENIANPISYSKVQKMILHSFQDTILKSLVYSIKVKQFYVRLQLNRMNNS